MSEQDTSAFEAQLQQIDQSLHLCENEAERADLLSLRNDILELIRLTKEVNGGQDVIDDQERNDVLKVNDGTQDEMADEYALFMQEMAKEGAIESQTGHAETTDDISDQLKELEGKKCSAPFKNEWGDVSYHNAMVCSVIAPDNLNYDQLEVKVMFTNPTLKKMLPCPYFLETDCKFSEEKCRFSHGETVLFSSLKEYVEPNFNDLMVGSKVLAKQPDKIWHRATVRRINHDKCVIRLETNVKEMEIDLHDILPLSGGNSDSSPEGSSESEAEELPEEDVINLSLMTTPAGQALGNWESHTKGIGSKLMEKMGYIIGTGLGKRSDGRIEPVTAVILPPGKSLDHCMQLREKAGGDKNLFSAERKLKRMQKREEIRSRKAYEQEKNKKDIFSFMNEKLLSKTPESVASLKSKHRQEIKQESGKSLNVASLKIDEEIKQCERDMVRIRESLSRHSNGSSGSKIQDSLNSKLGAKQLELKLLKEKASNIKHEQKIRDNKKKMTVF